VCQMSHDVEASKLLKMECYPRNPHRAHHDGSV